MSENQLSFIIVSTCSANLWLVVWNRAYSSQILCWVIIIIAAVIIIIFIIAIIIIIIVIILQFESFSHHH